MHNTISILAATSSHHHKRQTTTTGADLLIGDPNAPNLLKYAALGMCSLLALLALGLFIGWLFHRDGRYRPEVAAVIVAPLAAVSGWVVGLTLGHPTLGAWAALPVLAGLVAMSVRLHQGDRRAGKDRRRRAEARLGLIGVCRAVRTAKEIGTAQPNHDEIIVGHTSTRIVKLVRGWSSGRHVGVLGAPGSGKSTTLAAMLEQHICGIGDGIRHGAVVLDPKGDPAIRAAAYAAAQAAGAPFIEFTPQGGVVYDVLAGGDVDRRTDKILAAEEWTEPNYLAGATTYLREVMRTLEATGTHATLSKVLALMDPDCLEAHAAKAGPAYAKQLGDYLAGLTPRQKADLSGLRDRIAALGRSDMAAWLDPDRNPTAPRLDLGAAVRNSAVVLFTLQADDYPMLSKKLAAAIVLDLIAIAQRRQTRPVPTFVAIDEFGAIDSDLVLRLLARARGAGFSVALAAQTLADFSAASPDGSMATRVIGNLNALIVGRLNDAAEAETIAETAGTKDSWTTTQRTNLLLPANEGTRTLDRDFLIHPDQIKTLRRGEAAVIGLDPIDGQRRVEITRVRTPRLA
jgi:conjugal transfer pilus assembly protein TraD